MNDMIRDGFFEAVGFGFIANHGAKVLHRFEGLLPGCGVSDVERGGYRTEVWTGLLGGFCGFCDGWFCFK